MSILIKDVNLPKDREILLRIDENGQVYVYSEYPTKLYQAIELPSHGRLIDADALTHRYFQWPSVCNALSYDAPTIIEREE